MAGDPILFGGYHGDDVVVVMKRREWIARCSILIVLSLLIIVPIWFRDRNGIIHASIPENGGWSANVLHAEVGTPLTLKITSDDVVHGFAVGLHDSPAVDIEPGKVSEVVLNFSRPGTYTFYCTRWCGVNHWRMRGTIEVNGESTLLNMKVDPLYVRLGLNIDTPHYAKSVPPEKPVAARGNRVAMELAIDRSSTSFRSNSPEELFTEMNGPQLTDQLRWDVVAALWMSQTDAGSIEKGAKIYRTNCAACHGEGGGGDGVYAGKLAADGESSLHGMSGSMDMSLQTPADLRDPTSMMGAKPAVLHGKILRGGMGTGMPSWGSILTDEQIWNVVDYLFSLQFETSP